MLTPFINGLPFEVLKKVFESIRTVGTVRSGKRLRIRKNIISKEDLMTCSTVCRMWRRALQDFLRRKLSVTVHENELTSLLSDIPQFSDRVSHIQVKGSNVIMDRGKTSLDLLNILLICPNLVSVEFQFGNISEYLQALINSARRLDHIKCFRITPELSVWEIKSEINLLMQFQVKYKATTTCFVLCCVDEIPLKSAEYLIRLVSTFPKLISFECYSDLNYNYSDLFIDQLLEATHQPLQSVVLDISGTLCISSREPPENTSVTVLELVVSKIKIRALEYILTKFKNLENLYLTIFNLDEPLSIEELKQILKNPSTRIKYVSFRIFCDQFTLIKKYNDQEIGTLPDDSLIDSSSDENWDEGMIDVVE